MQLVQFAQRRKDGWRQWFASNRIRPCEVLYQTSHGTGSRSRTQSWSSSASRNLMQTTFRPFAGATRLPVAATAGPAPHAAQTTSAPPPALAAAPAGFTVAHLTAKAGAMTGQQDYTARQAGYRA